MSVSLEKDCVTPPRPAFQISAGAFAAQKQKLKGTPQETQSTTSTATISSVPTAVAPPVPMAPPPAAIKVATTATRFVSLVLPVTCVKTCLQRSLANFALRGFVSAVQTCFCVELQRFPARKVKTEERQEAKEIEKRKKSGQGCSKENVFGRWYVTMSGFLT